MSEFLLPPRDELIVCWRKKRGFGKRREETFWETELRRWQEERDFKEEDKIHHDLGQLGAEQRTEHLLFTYGYRSMERLYSDFIMCKLPPHIGEKGFIDIYDRFEEHNRRHRAAKTFH